MLLKTYFLLILCVLFWASNFVLGRYLHDEFEPIALAFYRWLGVFLIVLPLFILYFKPIKAYLKQHFLHAVLLAFFSIVCFNTILYVGLEQTTATNALLINSFFPIIVIVLSFFILKKAITANQAIGIALSTIGVLFIVLKGQISDLLELQLNKGDIYIITASLTWALYSVLLRYKPITLTPTQFFTTMVVLGFIMLLPIYLFLTLNISSDFKIVASHYEFIAYLVVFPSFLSYFFWNRGILEIGAQKTGQFTHLMPIFGATLAFLFLDETLELYHFLGMVLIFGGIYLSLFLRRN